MRENRCHLTLHATEEAPSLKLHVWAKLSLTQQQWYGRQNTSRHNCILTIFNLEVNKFRKSVKNDFSWRGYIYKTTVADVSKFWNVLKLGLKKFFKKFAILTVFNVRLSLSKKDCVIYFIESPIKMMKNTFQLIHLKSSFRFQDFKFLSWRFGHVEKMTWL